MPTQFFPARSWCLLRLLVVAWPLTLLSPLALASEGPGAIRLAASDEQSEWAGLSPAQQQALAPLEQEWAMLDTGQKRRWLAIAARYAQMPPAQQARLQQRMREWRDLTPEQRQIARDSYARARKLKPQQKNAEWEQYQLLTPEQKKQLAEEAAEQKRRSRLPGPAASDPGPPPASTNLD